MSEQVQSIDMPRVRLDVQNDVVRRILPGASIVANVGGVHGVVIGYRVTVEADALFMVRKEDAEAYVTALCEQVRIRAIRDLGLKPILDAQEREVRKYQANAQALSSIAADRAKRIMALEDKIERLECETCRDTRHFCPIHDSEPF